MSQSEIKADVYTQYHRAIEMFREAIHLFPEAEWKHGETDYLRPAGVAFHVVECLDFYTQEKPGKEFPWGYRFNVNWYEPESAKLPDKDQVLTYLSEMETKLANWFEDNDLLSEEKLMPKMAKTMLGRAVYGIRHMQHHLSEMAQELTSRGYKAPEWK